jgi:hypothetical protein
VLRWQPGGAAATWAERAMNLLNDFLMPKKDRQVGKNSNFSRERLSAGFFQ